jgi:hypothetical protein
MSYASAFIDRPTAFADQPPRHPFRATLALCRAPSQKPVSKRVPMGDRQLFVMTFIAGFMAFYGFLS